MLHRTWSSDLPVPEAIENEVTCMRLAQKILDDFRQVPEEHPKYTFPFLHYLTSATIIALGLIIKQPSFGSTYGALTLKAARSLKEHCRKTWVSTKMIQTVWKLNEMAEAALNPERLSDKREIPGGTGGSTVQQANPRGLRRRSSVSRSHIHRGSRSTSDVRNLLQTGNWKEDFATPHGLSYRDSGERKRDEVDGMHDTGYTGSDIGQIASSPLAEHPVPSAINQNVSIQGEVVDDGLQWLQNLFVNGLDTTLPPVWD